MSAKYIFDEGLLCKIYKGFLKLNNKKINNLIKIWAKDLNVHLIKEVNDKKAYEEMFLIIHKDNAD